MNARQKILFALSLALALGSIAYTLYGPGGGKQAQLQAELEQLRNENLQIQKDNQRLALEVNALKKRRDYLEKLARDELGLLKSDEVIIQLPQRPVKKEEPGTR